MVLASRRFAGAWLTKAFLFYAEPNPFAIIDITATDNFGNSVSVAVNGSAGASGYGFYSIDDQTIASIDITSTRDFAIGELAMATTVPDAGIMWLLGSSLFSLCFLSRRRK